MQQLVRSWIPLIAVLCGIFVLHRIGSSLSSGPICLAALSVAYVSARRLAHGETSGERWIQWASVLIIAAAPLLSLPAAALVCCAYLILDTCGLRKSPAIPTLLLSCVAVFALMRMLPSSLLGALWLYFLIQHGSSLFLAARPDPGFDTLYDAAQRALGKLRLAGSKSAKLQQ